MSELIDPISKTWDEELVRELFCVEDQEVILAIPIKHDMEIFFLPGTLIERVNFQSNLPIRLALESEMMDYTGSRVHQMKRTMWSPARMTYGRSLLLAKF